MSKSNQRRRNALELALMKLDADEQFVLKTTLLYNLPKTQNEVGRMFGVSGATIGNIEQRALEKLKAAVLGRDAE